MKFLKPIVPVEDWSKYKITAGFTTRHFPVFFKKSDELYQQPKRGQFCSAFPTPNKFILMNQVHDNRVCVLDDVLKSKNTKDFYYLPDTDGVVTSQTGLTLLVVTADCLPIFFYAKSSTADAVSWIGAVHAGWRGTDKKISECAATLLCQKATCKPSDISVVFGSRIGADHYEVGEEFRNYFAPPALIERNGGLYFDLAAENARQLTALGVPAANITDLAICTVCENEHFYSFRKEKEAAGRLISFITKT